MTDRGSIIAWTAALIAVSACQVTPEYETPPTADAAASADFEAFAGERVTFEEPVASWWREFDDPLLAELVQEALKANNDLRVAVAQLRAARALLSETQLDRLPTVEARAAYSRQRLSAAGSFTPVADRTVDNYEAGFDAFWELDFFGRVGQRVDASGARVQAADAALDDAFVTVAAETARAYLDLRGSQYAFDVARRNERNQAETLRLTETLRDGGRATALDVARARTQLELTRSELPPLEARIESAVNRLGVLTALGTDAVRVRVRAPKPLPSLPGWINVGDASGLIRRRADIRKVERELAAATADYGVAVASLYPSVSLLGSAGFQSVAASDFGSDASEVFTIGPAIRWPAFNLGRVRAQVRQADARADASLARFEQQVLVALEEVQSALANFAREDERRQTLYQAARSANQAARIARLRFDQGLDDFLDVLDAERVLLDTESRLAESETRVATNLIAVYKALGGGWQVAPRP